MAAATLKILIVDDDTDFCNLLSELICKKIGVKPRCAHSAIEGEKMVCEWQPDILITDTNMPDKNGIELIRTVAPKLPSMRIISLFNGLENSDIDQDDILEMGVFMVLTKADLQEKLIPTLQAIVAGRHLFLALRNIFKGLS